jgi:hypothetical protein
MISDDPSRQDLTDFRIITTETIIRLVLCYSPKKSRVSTRRTRRRKAITNSNDRENIEATKCDDIPTLELGDGSNDDGKMELNKIQNQPSLIIDLTIKNEQDAKSGNTEVIVHVVPSAVPLINPTSEVTKTSPPSGEGQLHFAATERISSSSLTPPPRYCLPQHFQIMYSPSILLCSEEEYGNLQPPVFLLLHPCDSPNYHKFLNVPGIKKPI